MSNHFFFIGNINIFNTFLPNAKEYTKALLKEKDMVVAQYIIKKQQEKIEQLEAEKQELEKTNDKYLQKLVYCNYTLILLYLTSLPPN